MPGRRLTPDEVGHRLVEVFAVIGPLYRRVERAVERSEPLEGITIGVRAVLDQLRAHGPLTVPQMSRSQALSRQFVQRMVNDARAGRLVQISANPAHRRSSLIQLTPRGLEAITAVTRREHQLLRQVGGDLSADDIETCLAVLNHMLDLFADVDVDDG